MTSGPYPRRLQEIIDALAETSDRDFRAEVLIDFAGRFHDVPREIAVRPFDESHRVPACQSDAFVWMKKLDDGGLRPYFAVENPQGISAKALAAILAETLAGESEEVYNALDEELVRQIFGNTISMGKGEGLMGMVRMVRAMAATSTTSRFNS